jgi:DNA-binding transcriptional MerR regulator
MFKIHDFARLSQVSVRTLHYYDQLGLLKPMRVDPFTGYRYYSAEQLPRLNRILALKDLGFTLEQITDLLRGELPPPQLRDMLRLKQVELQQRVQDEQARLVRVEARLRQIEQEDTMPAYEVLLKHIDPLQVAAVREILQTDGDPDRLSGDIDRLLNEVYAYLSRFNVAYVGPALVVWHDDDRGVDDVGQEAELAVPVAGAVPSSEGAQYYELPAVETMACTVHHGSANTLAHAYAALHAWVASNGYRVIGPSRTISIHAAGNALDSAAVIEVQLPVIREQRTESIQWILAPADLARLTERSKQALAFAVEEAGNSTHAVLDTGDLLIGLLREEKGFAGYLLGRMGLAADAARSGVRNNDVSEASVGGQRMTEPARRVFVQAVEEARQRAHDYIGTEHILLALAREHDGVAIRMFERMGVAPDQIHVAVNEQLQRVDSI